MSVYRDNYLKHGVPGVQFKYDTADTPDVTRIRPAQLCSITQQLNIVYQISVNRTTTTAILYVNDCLSVLFTFLPSLLSDENC